MRGVSGPCDTSRAFKQHDLASDAGKHMIDFEVVEARLDGELVAQQFAQRRDVPLAVAELNSPRRSYRSRSTRKIRKKARFACVDAELGVEHEQGLPNGVDDVEQQLLGNGHVRPASPGDVAGLFSVEGNTASPRVECNPVTTGRCIGRSATHAH